MNTKNFSPEQLQSTTFTMKQVCEISGLPYETLKFYCNSGLIPDLKRDSGNRRIFNAQQLGLVMGLLCLRDCGMGVQEMKRYMDILTSQEPDIPALQVMLEEKRSALEETISRAQESLRFIDRKQDHYNRVRSGERGLFDLPPDWL